MSREFDAVVCAMGTLKPNYLDKSFKENEHVEDGLDFLMRVNEKSDKRVGKNVVIIGGGYTSMDCARTALTWRKNLKTFYRREQGI